MQKKIEIEADCCRACRFENYGSQGRWCVLYDNLTESDRGIKKPDWCKVTSVTIEEKEDD